MTTHHTGTRDEWLAARLALLHGEKEPTRGAAGWLALAAAPTFALMALLTGVPDGEPMGMLCSAAHGTSPLNGMALMYALMSMFHGAAWLKWIAGRRRQRTRRAAVDG
jgi:hypothetical protein